jgi:uncharacterized membrane protein YphA (DoxX/SURF4 family)
VGLVLLRAALSAYCILTGVSAFSSEKSEVLSGYSGGAINFVIGAFLLAGFLTPVAGLFSMLSGTMEGLRSLPGTTSGNQNPALLSLILVVVSAAVVLLGPGAFSVDARLFGRREIIIPRRKISPPRSPSE